MNKLIINQDYMVDFSNFSTTPYSNKKRPLPFRRKIEDLEEVIIHCTAAGTSPWENPLTCIKYDLGPNHISRSGLATATYHYYVNQKGECFQLVSMEMQTAHCIGQNERSVAICINHNGFDSSEITPELYETLVKTICHVFDMCDWGYDYYGVSERLIFHRNYSNKACPGMLEQSKLINDTVNALKDYGDNV